MTKALRKAVALLHTAIHIFASLKMAISLIVILAVVIAYATIVEVNHGRQYSQWFVYHSSWFIALLGLLGASVFCAAYVRFPWKRHQTGFVITHAGLLVLLIGSIVTYSLGVEGQIALVEGASTSQLTLNERSQITAFWSDRTHDRPYVFTFDSGPVDWKLGTDLDLGNVDGLSARVVRYYQRGEAVENWAADSTSRGGPMIRFQLSGTHGGGQVEHDLVDADFGAEIFVGPIAIRLQRAVSDAMLADFLRPPANELGEKGVLTVYSDNHVQHVSVDPNVGQTIALGNSGGKVELVQYLANAKLDAAGQFQSIGQDLRNPLVELKVTLPGEEGPYRQVAYAKSPLLNFDGVYERNCPVKFVYEHPKVGSSTAIEFLRAENGKLFGRTIENGKPKAHGEVTKGSRIPLPLGFTFTVAEYLPYTRREVSFRTAERKAGEKDGRESAAVKVEIASAGVNKNLWLQHNHPDFGSGVIQLPEGALRINFTNAQVPFGFEIQLVDFKRELNPGKTGNAAYSSIVRLIDNERKIDDERTISMNQPLSHRGFRFYQSSFREAGHGKEASILSVAYDPGRVPKYLGSLMVCLGIATMFYMKAYFFRQTYRIPSTLVLPNQALFEDHVPKVA